MKIENQIIKKNSPLSPIDKITQNRINDLKISEINYGNILIKGDTAICIKDNNYHLFDIKHKAAKQGDLIYITKPSGFLNKHFVGKFYKVHSREPDMCVEYRDKNTYAMLRAVDLHNDMNEYFFKLDDSQYIVLNEYPNN